ncbi:hypothetical protein BH09PSE5_BH09PSE5_27670 [soil metagenome]
MLPVQNRDPIGLYRHEFPTPRPMTEASFQSLILAFDPRGVATLTLAREDALNAFDAAMVDELMWAFAVLSGDPRVRVIVLEARGRAFSAGVDLKWMRETNDGSADHKLADARRMASMMQTIHECPKPVIARVQGAAYGGGVGLCCVCDVVLAAPQARFSIGSARLGVVPAVIAPYLLNAIGKRETQRLALTGETIGAARAAELHLVSEVVADEDMDSAVERLVSMLLANGPEAMEETKALFRQLTVGPVDAETRELTAQTMARFDSSAEAREGLDAFLEKRPAVFSTKEVTYSRRPDDDDSAQEQPVRHVKPEYLESGFDFDAIPDAELDSGPDTGPDTEPNPEAHAA